MTSFLLGSMQQISYCVSKLSDKFFTLIYGCNAFFLKVSVAHYWQGGIVMSNLWTKLVGINYVINQQIYGGQT